MTPPMIRWMTWPAAVEAVAVQAAAPAQARWRGRFHATIFLILAVAHTLLPIERGFPVIRFTESYPLTLAMIASMVCFVCLAIESGGAIWQTHTPKTYVRWQSAFVALLALSALTGGEPKPAFFVVLNYFLTFVLNFLSLRYLFSRGQRRTFAALVCVVAAAAAVVGLMERLFGYYLPFYREFFLNVDYAQMSYVMSQTAERFRNLGPLGNPILHAVVLSLAMPFALELKGFLRWCMVALLGISILLSTSMTGVLMLGFYVLGKLAGYAWRARVLALIAGSILLTGVAAVVANGNFADRGSPFQRALYGDERSIQMRLQMVDMGVSKILNSDEIPVLLAGRGLKSSGELVIAGGASYSSTFDNVWLTVAYEAGIPAAVVCILMQAAILYQLRRFAGKNQWWGILAWCAAGASFVTIYYATANFLWVALVAWLWTMDGRTGGRGEWWRSA